MRLFVFGSRLWRDRDFIRLTLANLDLDAFDLILTTDATEGVAVLVAEVARWLGTFCYPIDDGLLALHPPDAAICFDDMPTYYTYAACQHWRALDIPVIIVGHSYARHYHVETIP